MRLAIGITLIVGLLTAVFIISTALFGTDHKLKTSGVSITAEIVETGSVLKRVHKTYSTTPTVTFEAGGEQRTITVSLEESETLNIGDTVEVCLAHEVAKINYEDCGDRN